MDKNEVIPTVQDVQINNPVQPDALSNGMSLMQMKTNHLTQIAAQKPRNLNVVRDKILVEANLSGEQFYYQWSAGGSEILGISIQGAMILARNWMNCVAECINIEEKRDCYLFYASFVDYETNFAVTRAHKIKKDFTIYGKYDEARKDQMRFEIGQSKAIRNSILAALPEWLKQAAMDEAMSGVRKKIEKEIKAGSKPVVIEKLLKSLVGKGVNEQAILAKFNVKDSKALTIDDLVIMYGDLKAITGGSEFAETLYPQLNEQKTEHKIDELKKNAAKKADKTRKKKADDKPPAQKAKPESEQKPEPEADPDTGEVPADDNPAKDAFIQEWSATTPAARLEKFIQIKGQFNLEKYCEGEQIKVTKNYNDIPIYHQANVLWIITEANRMTNGESK